MADAIQNKSKISSAVATATVNGNTAAKTTMHAEAPAIDLDSKEFYLNRELTWLSFNSRVLSLAATPNTPLLERVKYLAITGNNLDEFQMKRIGGLKQQQAAGVRVKSIDGRTPGARRFHW